MESSPTMDKVRTREIYTNPERDWRHDAPLIR